MQKITIKWDTFYAEIEGEHGVALATIHGFIVLHPLQDQLREAVKAMEEPPCVWLLDLTRANICKLGVGTDSPRQRHANGDRFLGAYALIVRPEDVQVSRMYVRRMPHEGVAARAVFGAAARREAYAWAAAQASLLRRLDAGVMPPNSGPL